MKLVATDYQCSYVKIKQLDSLQLGAQQLLKRFALILPFLLWQKHFHFTLYFSFVLFFVCFGSCIACENVASQMLCSKLGKISEEKQGK